jgi:hypothetical protein
MEKASMCFMEALSYLTNFNFLQEFRRGVIVLELVKIFF